MKYHIEFPGKKRFPIKEWRCDCWYFCFRNTIIGTIRYWHWPLTNENSRILAFSIIYLIYFMNIYDETLRLQDS